MLGRIYSFLNRTSGKLSLVLNSCFAGFWMGILTRGDFHSIDERKCNRSRQWVSEAHNNSGFFEWENTAVNKYFRDCKRIMVIAAGGGREVLALHKAGYGVDGFECNGRLVEFANRLFKEEKLDLKMGLVPRDHGPNNGKIYDGTIVGWGAYMLIQGRKARVRLLKSLRQQVRDGSPILLSFFARSNTENARYEKISLAIANAIRRSLFREPLEEGDRLDSNFRHLFTPEEIAAELSEGGFRLADFGRDGYPHAVGIA